jgi:SAM-dependent methyltransferase
MRNQSASIARDRVDDWDQHWTEISPSSDIGPSTAYRSRVIRNLLRINRPGDGARVLEIGSGTGSFAEKFVSDYPQAAYLGLDMSATGVRLSADKVPSATFRQRDLLQPPGNADDLEFCATHAIASEVLEHVDDPAKLLRASTPYMAPGCRLIVTVPGGPINAFYKHIGHRRHYTPGDLSELIRSAGFEVEYASGIGFPFYNIYMWLLLQSGERAIELVSGPPGVWVRAASSVFNALFHLNSMKAGWQMIAVARWPG